MHQPIVWPRRAASSWLYTGPTNLVGLVKAGSLPCTSVWVSSVATGWPGKGHVNLCPLRRRRRGERAPVKLGALCPRSGRGIIPQFLLQQRAHHALAFGAQHVEGIRWHV